MLEESPASGIKPIHPHHVIRTLFASLFGTIAMALILVSIVVVWLNRTLTDTNTYVSTVAPLVTKPAIQNYVAQQASGQLISNAPITDLAQTLLPASVTANQTNEQLQTLVRPIVVSSVLQVIKSSSFAAVWQSTNQTAHAALVKQLDANSSDLTLDLHPLVTSVITELGTTQLAPAISHISIPADAGKLDLTGSSIDKIHHYYVLFKQLTIVIVCATLLAIILCVIVSVHHFKTARRIVIGTGIIALVLALLIAVPGYIFESASDSQQSAIVAIGQTLTHNLMIVMFIVAGVCLLGGIASEIYSHIRHKNQKTT